MNAIENVDLQNQAVGLLFEGAMGRLLKELDPTLKHMRSTKSTDAQYIADFRIDDQKGNPRQLIEIKSHRWFSSVDDRKSVLENMLVTSVERSKASGRPSGLLHQYLQSVHRLDDDYRDSCCLVIVGLYDVPGHIHASKMLSEDEQEQRQALSNYKDFLLLWVRPKHVDGYSCLLSGGMFEQVVKEFGLFNALDELSDLAHGSRPLLGFTGEDIEIVQHVPYCGLLPESYNEYDLKYANSLCDTSTDGGTYNNQPWYADQPIKIFELPSPDQEPMNEDEELPDLITDVDLSVDDFRDIRDGILADMSLTDISKVLGKSEAYLSGLLSRSHPKYDEFKRWILPIMKKVDHQSLPDPTRYEKMMKTSNSEESSASDQSGDVELSKVVQRQNQVILDRQAELDELKLQNETLQKALDEVRSRALQKSQTDKASREAREEEIDKLKRENDEFKRDNNNLRRTNERLETYAISYFKDAKRVRELETLIVDMVIEKAKIEKEKDDK